MVIPLTVVLLDVEMVLLMELQSSTTDSSSYYCNFSNKFKTKHYVYSYNTFNNQYNNITHTKELHIHVYSNKIIVLTKIIFRNISNLKNMSLPKNISPNLSNKKISHSKKY